ncbi:MAG: acyl-CoA dehydrogenase family protein, partial [Bacteroidota bacterium]
MIPRYIFNEDHDLFRDMVRKFMETEIAPHHAEWEKQGHISREAWLKAGEQGLLCVTMPEEYGGSGVDFGYSVILMEEQAYTYASGPGFSLHTDICAPYILHYGSDEMKQKYLPRMATGELISAIAMTEPGTGSDLQGVRTTAVKEGDHYILNGSKTFITNGYMSDIVIVVAKTDLHAGAAGTSLFLVETASEGFSKNPPLQKIGMKAQDTCEMFMDNVKVPAENLIGQEGMGFMYLMQELPQERLLIAIVAIAAAQQVLKDTIRYTKEREAFGRQIFKFQNTRFKLAEYTARLEMAQAYLDRCIELHLKGELDVPSAAACKLVCSDLQCELIDECLQLHGGYGYIWD